MSLSAVALVLLGPVAWHHLEVHTLLPLVISTLCSLAVALDLRAVA